MFIFLLAIFHIVVSMIMVLLAHLRISQWRKWSTEYDNTAELWVPSPPPAAARHACLRGYMMLQLYLH